MIAESYRTGDDANDLYETFYKAISAEQQQLSPPEQAEIDVPNSVLQGLHPDTTSVHEIIQKVKKRVLFDQGLIRRRFSRLLAPAHQFPSLVEDLDGNIVSTVCSEIQIISWHCPPVNRLDKLIICNYASTMRIDHNSFQQQPADGPESALSILEQCEICGKNIAFESLRWARCIAGHQFGKIPALRGPISD